MNSTMEQRDTLQVEENASRVIENEKLIIL